VGFLLALGAIPCPGTTIFANAVTLYETTIARHHSCCTPCFAHLPKGHLQKLHQSSSVDQDRLRDNRGKYEFNLSLAFSTEDWVPSAIVPAVAVRSANSLEVYELESDWSNP
jgi:hypothetical protein